MLKVGFVGWRGIVGSVLINRMIKKKDFDHINSFFFSTSHDIKKNSNFNKNFIKIYDAYDIEKLNSMNIIVSCQGSFYTKKIHHKLRKKKWKGYWIDSASELRMKEKSIIALDPVNKFYIDKALSNGVLDFIGGNCTVSLMLMALHGLIDRDYIEWIISSTYQAVSGGGSNKVNEMLVQMKIFGNKFPELAKDRSITISEIDQIMNSTKQDSAFSTKYFGIPIVNNIIPWIDKIVENGQTKEEWKGSAETNKIMNLSAKNSVKIDGQCVRVNTIRCHSQALTVKLKKNISLNDISLIIENSNKWIKIIPNNEKSTISKLTPHAVSGTMNIHIGRLRKLNIGNEYLNGFTVGDQLLWGGAEPIRRVLNIIIKYLT
jgi:aspartate-semialdehyde dehydrogenase